MHQGGGLNVLHVSQPVPTAQWPELAARSFSWLWQNEKWLRMHQGDGLNVLHVSQLVPTAQWPELAARSFSWLWQKKMAADASRRWPERAARFSAGSNGSVA